MISSLKRVKAIAKREFLAYFNSALAYVFLIVFLILGSVFTFNFANWFDSDEASLRVFFSIHPYLYLFFVPAIGMRVWAEEDREGTLELLLTMPISAWHAVVGKFLAGWFFLGFALLLTFPMVINVAYLGDPDVGRLFSGYLGSFLTAGMCFSLTSLTSAFTTNQVISFLFGFIALLLITVIGMPQLALLEYIKSVLPQPLIDTLLFFSIQPHVEGLEKGVMDIRDIIYFISFMLFGLSASTIILRCRKAAHKYNRSLTSAGIIVFAIIVLLVNYLARGINYRQDLSADKLYTLTASTKKVLARLDGTAAVRFYFSASDSSISIKEKAYAQRVEDLLKEYQAMAAGKVSYRLIDPQPGSIEEESAALDGIEPIVKADRTKKYFGISVSYKGNIKTIAFVDPDHENRLEYELTNLLKHLTKPEMPVIGFLTDVPVVEQNANPMAGQYENRPAWRVIDELKKDYTVIRIEDKYPDWGRLDGTNYFDLVIIYKFGFMNDKSRLALDQYLLRGGKAIIITDSFPLLAPEVDKTFRFQSDRLPYMGNTLGIVEPWKISLAYKFFISDKLSATQVSGSKNPALLTLDSKDFNRGHMALNKIEKVIFPYPGYFIYERHEGIEVTPLITAKASAGLVKTTEFAKNEVIETTKELPIMLQVKGKLPSFYRGETFDHQHVLTAPQKESELILIADMDFLKDSYTFAKTIQESGKKDHRRVSENLEMFLNLTDSMVTAGEMIDVRMRREKRRRLYKLEEIRARQRQGFVEEVKKIQAEYQQKERVVDEFYRKQENQIKLTEEELLELKEAEVELRFISDRLNAIQHKFNQMDKKTRHVIVFSTSASVPILIIIGWLLVVIYRKRRLKSV